MKPATVQYIVNHVFLPPKLPQKDDQDCDNEVALCNLVRKYAQDHQRLLPTERQSRWDPILNMLENFEQSLKSEALNVTEVEQNMEEMQVGDLLVLFIRAQNAGVIFRHRGNDIVYEAFEVSPSAAAVMGTSGKLVCSYPGPAISIPLDIFSKSAFCHELSTFLAHMNVDVLDSAPTTTKARSTVLEERDTAHPRYITDLLTGILRGIGKPAEGVVYVRKRIADDVLWNDARLPWRRSPVWHVLRVALQTTLTEYGVHDYKVFMTFLHAKFLSFALEHALDSDLLFVMRAKTSRRLHKLESQIELPRFLVDTVATVANKVEAVLQKRWKDIQAEQSRSPHWDPSQLDFVADTNLSLPHSTPYISERMKNRGTQQSPTPFQPKLGYPRRLRELTDFHRFDLATLTAAFASEDVFVALADFEEVVGKHLDTWVTDHLHETGASATVFSCMNQYTSVASSNYAENPENQSIMLLTLFSLWVALDRISVHHCPLLGEYSPEIPRSLLQPLLLRKREHFLSLITISQYIYRRHSHAIYHNSVFADPTTSTTFPVRFFDTSPELQGIKRQIEAAAHNERQQKITEFDSKKARYRTLVKEVQEIEHDHEWRRHWRGYEYQDKSGCRKCSLESEAANLTISVHEWPLPENQDAAKTAVFELKCPPVFVRWRAATYMLLQVTCTPSTGRIPQIDSTTLTKLSDYTELTRWLDITHDDNPITLASEEKSFTRSHYSYKNINQVIYSDVREICVNNGLRWRIFDQGARCWAADPSEKCSISHLCTLILPKDGLYDSLQYAVDGTSHTSNDVLTSQCDCSSELSLHEYVAFGHLRSGERVQWWNIVRELAARSLTFGREQVHTLLTQAALQVGEISEGGVMEWHRELDLKVFGGVLLDQVESLLSDVAANWKDAASLRSAILLVSRLLASTDESSVIGRGYSLLRRARTTSLHLTRNLMERLPDCGEDFVRDFQVRVCEMAATCRSTYDVDSTHIVSLLNSHEDVSVFLECAVAIYDNTSPSHKSPNALSRLLHRDRRLAHYLEPFVVRLISNDRFGLDKAISSIWPAYRPGSSWICEDRWFISHTLPAAGQGSQQVHLNILEGRLLIAGNPLGCLPRTILNHSIYLRVFGQKLLSVIPADLPGMVFATRSLVAGYQIFFALSDENGLIIQTVQNAQILELIPHNKLQQDLPTLFSEQFTHWLDLASGQIECRPLESIWESSSKNWRVNLSPTSSNRMVLESSRYMVDIHSPTFRMVSAALKNFEHREFLTVIYSCDSKSLSVDLPRFRLSFLVNSTGSLESHNLPGMVLDSDQSTGTMFGLSSRLVLKDRVREGFDLYPARQRVTLIPVGKVAFKRSGNHAEVHVDTLPEAWRQVKYHKYVVDTELGRLIGNGSLEAKLYKIYLHALTSHCLPDPLVHCTGTEEALRELDSAGCLSFQRLRASECHLLCQIGALTPTRTYYPRHLEVMATVKWRDLPCTSQHYGFRKWTQVVFDYAEQLNIFQQDHDKFQKSSHEHAPSSDRLLIRASHRCDLFYSAEASATGPIPVDTVYPSRDLPHMSSMELDIICQTSHRVAQALSHGLATLDASEHVELWPEFLDWDSLQAPNPNEPTYDLSYRRDWLRPELPDIWISLYRACVATATLDDAFGLLFALSAMAYGSPDYRKFIPQILMFTVFPEFSRLVPPRRTSYNLSSGTKPDREEVLGLIVSSALPLTSSPAYDLTESSHENRWSYERRRKYRYETDRDTNAVKITAHFMSQWPTRDPESSVPTQILDKPADYFDTARYAKSVKKLFRSCHSNKELFLHIQEIQNMLKNFVSRGAQPLYDTGNVYTPMYHHPSQMDLQHNNSHSRHSSITLDTLLSAFTPTSQSDLSAITLRRNHGYHEHISKSTEHPSNKRNQTTNLKTLLSEFHSSEFNRPSHQSRLRERYGHDLEASRKAFVDDHATLNSLAVSFSAQGLIRYREQCGARYQEAWEAVRQSLTALTQAEKMVELAGQWPSVNPQSLFRRLGYITNSSLTSEWRHALTSLACDLLEYQRSQRLVLLHLDRRFEDFAKEVESLPFDMESALERPDWLLIQLESNFLARGVQRLVAAEMMSPTSKQNSVLQLNMGEGKSAVIVPMVAASLANGQKLVRVIVLKSLAGQMFQILVERLTGLANRRIFYLPFSRKANIGQCEADQIQGLYQTCMDAGGVLVAQPEHILSSKLMTIDRMLTRQQGHDHTPISLLETQKWLDSHSRDILDESDEILHARYQLIYTVGEQMLLEDHPDRWVIIQQVLSLARKHIAQIQLMFPQDVEVHWKDDHASGGFPNIRLLDQKPGNALVELIIDDILHGALQNVPFRSFAGPETDIVVALRCYMTQIDIQSDHAELIERRFLRDGRWKCLYLLRGLLAHGILVYVLKERRWRVDYGLDPGRSMLAVPYRAKDVPALRAEFGHPDIALLLTCLSYYYGGLTSAQVALCFQLLFRLDHPDAEYGNWIRRVSVPEDLREISAINTDDPEQHRDRLFPLFCRNHALINFYLSTVIFPKAAKEFPQKLSTSGWDLAERKAHVTTGFSGTNDNRYVLPTSISQKSVPGQEGTNAKVLMYLLQPENNHYVCASVDSDYKPDQSIVGGTLNLLVKQTPTIRVLLDVGAQMLEMRNEELAKAWLLLRSDAPAAIFFNAEDELTVVTRDGITESFLSSPFKQQIDTCLVYLDDAHTRGTDLVLPKGSRAAVTLGAKVTKDRLIQGCMRMRKLGHGHSVCFFAPIEVDRKLRVAANKGAHDTIEVIDILRWTMLESCSDIEHHIPHWTQQGLDFMARSSAWRTTLNTVGAHDGTTTLNGTFDQLKSAWLQPEAQTMNAMYGIQPFVNQLQSTYSLASNHPELGPRLEMLGVKHISSLKMDEEQEREVSHEIEQERSIERPPKRAAAPHAVHPDVMKFITKGKIPPQSSAFMTLVDSLAPADFAHVWWEKQPWLPGLLIATKDFAGPAASDGSLSPQPRRGDSEYMRPVNWIISSRHFDGLVVLSPFEINTLLPAIRESEHVSLHMYAPRVRQNMQPFDDLQFYCIPSPSPQGLPSKPSISLLSIFAGQLYLSDYEAYRTLCHSILGIYTGTGLSGSSEVAYDGFVTPVQRQDSCLAGSQFQQSPIPFLKTLLGFRRKGNEFTVTHMGKIMQGRILTKEDFD